MRKIVIEEPKEYISVIDADIKKGIIVKTGNTLYGVVGLIRNDESPCKIINISGMSGITYLTLKEAVQRNPHLQFYQL